MCHSRTGPKNNLSRTWSKSITLKVGSWMAIIVICGLVHPWPYGSEWITYAVSSFSSIGSAHLWMQVSLGRDEDVAMKRCQLLHSRHLYAALDLAFRYLAWVFIKRASRVDVTLGVLDYLECTGCSMAFSRDDSRGAWPTTAT